MADIAMCAGTECPRKNNCHRHTAEYDEYGQSYFVTPPIKEDGSCEYFWDNKEYPAEGAFHNKLEDNGR
jgi:hypothetical protein